MRLSILIMLIVFSSVISAEPFKERALWKTSTYLCKGNPNFLNCIKPEILSDLQNCVTYVIQGSINCSAKHLNVDKNTPEDAKMNIAMEFTYCAVMELIENENIKEAEFDECFDKNYDASIRSPILKK